jgi:hypothetical protein
VWPEGITSAEAAAFANVSRRSRVKGARYAHEKLRLELRAAKVLALHVTSAKGVCHRCLSQVSGMESVCTKCCSANLDW